MIYPSKLKLNDTIGIVAVSDGANLSKIDYSIRNFENIGFKIVETPHARNSKYLVSSSGKTRAEEFMNLWKSDRISCIISARGGEFLMEMLPYLDKYKNEILKYKTKWVQGFSDTSLLLYYLTTNFNIATIHAGNFGEFSMKEFHESLKDNIRFLTRNEEFVQNSFSRYQIEEKEDDPQNGYNLTEDVKYKLIDNEKKAQFSGRLIGGCIDILSILLGTKYDNTVKFCNQFEEGMIWYIDNYEMNAAELHRRLWQMREAGWFNNVKGFLFGRSYGGNKIGDFGFLEAIHYSLEDIGVPIIYDVDIGHLPPQFTIINGAYTEVEYNEGKATIIQKLI